MPSASWCSSLLHLFASLRNWAEKYLASLWLFVHVHWQQGGKLSVYTGLQGGTKTTRLNSDPTRVGECAVAGGGGGGGEDTKHSDNLLSVVLCRALAPSMD